MTVHTLLANKARQVMNLDWKRLLKLNQNEVLGLDIGSSAVKIVQLSKDGPEYKVTAAGIVKIAEETENSPDRKETNTVRAILDCLQLTAVKTKLAVCSISGPEVAVRYFKFPPLPAEEIPAAVRLEAEQVCPFNIADSTVDYQLIPDGNNSLCGVLVAATNKLINEKVRCAENASLKTVLMDVDALALLNCFNGLTNRQQKPCPDRATAILDVGSSHTNLAIMGKEYLPFVRDIAYAGNDITKAIANEHNVSTEIVADVLAGRETPGQPELELRESLARACQKLITDVTETLRYYTTQEKSAPVEKLLVCGSFAMVKGFVELLDSKLAVPAILWNPLENIPWDTEQAAIESLRENGPAMAVATGLAMRVI